MEWFNVIIEKIWRSIDPQVFAVVEDILEDTISRVTPKIIVSDIYEIKRKCANSII